MYNCNDFIELMKQLYIKFGYASVNNWKYTTAEYPLISKGTLSEKLEPPLYVIRIISPIPLSLWYDLCQEMPC